MITLRRIASTRGIVFLFSAFAFVLWTTVTTAVPKFSLLSVLRMAIEQSTSTTHTANNASYASDPAKNATGDLLVSEELNAGQLGIGIPQANLYVISLPDRPDRREKMEFLRASQGLTWTIIDATSRNATIIQYILDWVTFQRSQQARTPHAERTPFRWPEDINALSDSTEPLRPWGADAWGERSPHSLPRSSKFASQENVIPPRLPLACAVDDDTIPNLKNNSPEWTILTPAKIACWHSHVSALRQFVAANVSGVAIILEDDIDMEKDISRRLSNVWTSLPPGWDIVFLGHCWSNESTYSALTHSTDTNLHPSSNPKCTHAYALSLAGARRLLQHLRFPPFAYSRALDQAYAWLVRSGRLRSYSIVPSVVVQRKSDKSDISPGSGSEWREKLLNGVFGA